MKTAPVRMRWSLRSMASRKRLLIFVASAISLREMPRISRSRRSSSPKEANSECGGVWGCPGCYGMGRGTLRWEALLDAAWGISRRRRVALDGAQVGAAEMAQLRRRRGARRERIEDQGLADGVAVRPLAVVGEEAQLLGRGPRGAGPGHQVP